VDGRTLAVLVRQLRQLTGHDPAWDPDAPTGSADRVDLLRPRPAGPCPAIRPAPPAAAHTGERPVYFGEGFSATPTFARAQLLVTRGDPRPSFLADPERVDRVAILLLLPQHATEADPSGEVRGVDGEAGAKHFFGFAELAHLPQLFGEGIEEPRFGISADPEAKLLDLRIARGWRHASNLEFLLENPGGAT